MIKQELEKVVISSLHVLDITVDAIQIDYSSEAARGDFATNAAMIFAKKVGKQPMVLAEELAEKLRNHDQVKSFIEKIEVVKPGFINFFIKNEMLAKVLVNENAHQLPKTVLTGKKYFIEYAHPNTHKEMHIGHMRTLITGEALSRLAEAAGANVFRANYQGDIGLHVAKALYGIELLMNQKDLTITAIGQWNNTDKAHFLGQGYALGSENYEKNEKAIIDKINKDLYTKDSEMNKLYRITRQWSLDYYEEFYSRFYTKFDRLFFESEVAQRGLEIVKAHIGSVFEEQNGAVVFPGEKYGLHTRVFITQAGNPTYEGKEMGNAFNEYEASHFDMKIHIVGSEQAGYFQVIFKALELLDPEKFKGKQHHVSMGMVQFADRKMSSRTGDVLRVDWLIDQVKEQVKVLMKGERIPSEKLDETIEQIAIGAIKYSVLQVGTGQNVAFDINKSVSLDGNSGPYIQYVYARTQSVLKKGDHENHNKPRTAFSRQLPLTAEERNILRMLDRFDDIVTEAALKYAPNVLTTYLFDLAQAFNLFYQKCPILKGEPEVKDFRLQITAAAGNVIKEGLYLLGIQAPQQM